MPEAVARHTLCRVGAAEPVELVGEAGIEDRQRLDRAAQVVHRVEVPHVDADQAIVRPLGRHQALAEFRQQLAAVGFLAARDVEQRHHHRHRPRRRRPDPHAADPLRCDLS